MSPHASSISSPPVHMAQDRQILRNLIFRFLSNRGENIVLGNKSGKTNCEKAKGEYRTQQERKPKQSKKQDQKHRKSPQKTDPKTAEKQLNNSVKTDRKQPKKHRKTPQKHRKNSQKTAISIKCVTPSIPVLCDSCR
jgi:hypothetical protein